MTTETINPRIYVACLSCYNSGTLKGAWVNASQDLDDIHSDVAAMLASCDNSDGPHEEWAIHDTEGFGKIRLGENTDLSEVSQIAQAVSEHGEAYEIAYSNFSGHSEALEAVSEHYQGCWDSLEDWAEHYADDTGLLTSMPDNLRSYFDFERFARDCVMGGDIWSERGSEGTHVFWSY